MAHSGHRGSAPTFEDLSRYDTLACCLVCMENHDHPVQLDCNHIFCEQCLRHYYKLHCVPKDPDDSEKLLSCPTCQRKTSVPSSGLAALSLERRQSLTRVRKVSVVGENAMQRCEPCIYNAKTEEAEYYCNKCMLNFCQNCKNAHEQHSVFNSHSVIHISNKDAVNLYCSKHGKMSSTFFCNDCSVPACVVCVLLEHSTHQSTNLVDALSIRRDNLKQCLNIIGPRAEKLSTKLRKISQHFGKNHDLKHRHDSYSSNESIQKEIGNDIQMSSRKDSNDNVDYEIKAIEREIIRIQKLYQQASKITEVSQSKKLLIVYEELMSRLKTIIEVELNYIQEEIELKIESEVEHAMSIPSNGITPSISDRSLEKISKGGTSNRSSPEHSILSFDDGSENHSGHFMLFKPKLMWKVEKQRSEVSELANPSGITFDSKDRIIVAEYDIQNEKGNKILIYSPNAIKQYSLTNTISANHMKPLGVAVNRDGNIAVTDCVGKRVKVFNMEGHLIQEIGKGMFGWPYGIVCNSKGQYIVSDTFHDTVTIFSRDGRNRIKTFGNSGSGSLEFRNPFHLSVDSQDNIVISDSGNRCVKVFDIRGDYKYVSSEKHKHGGHDNKGKHRKLKGPRGIAVDIRDNILVADDSGKVCLFDPKAHFIRNLLTEEDSVKFPEALATNKDGYLAVTEWNPNNMVAIKLYNMYEK